MKKILVFGGTRFFGKRLVQKLVDRGHAVTLGTRGATPDPFGDAVERIALDRENLRALPAGRSWDVVVDQICYSSADAAVACEALSGRVGRYIHTSTQSIYPNFGEQREEDFAPQAHPIRLGSRADFDYAEGKRQAEAVFFQRADFPVAAMRIPIVLGTDDYTGRLEFHLNRVRDGKPIVIPSKEARTTFIGADEAASFLDWLIHDARGGACTGPINACATGHPTMGELMLLVEKTIGKRAETSATGDVEASTPFSGAESRCLSNHRATELGFKFSQLNAWLPKLMAEVAART